MFKIESYIGPLLMSYLNKYVKLNEESFKLSLWGGDAIFHNVELQCDILEHLMLLPIGFKSGQVHELKIHIPWTKLGSESVIITLNTVECILELKSDFIKKNKTDSPVESQNSEKLSPEKQKIEKNNPPGYIKSYLFNIINNIHVKVNNLIIKFVEDDIVLSMNAKSLEYFPVTESWLKGFTNMSSGNLKVYKIIEIFDLTICLDQMDSNGQIGIYQEPILYRCCVECRFLTNYKSINSNSPNFIKININFSEIHLNISTTQMPQIRRLIELIYALYYGIINWDSVVGCGFSNQLIVNNSSSRDLKDASKIEFPPDVDVVDKDSQKSWASWAWSYVPSIFGDDESFIDDDLMGNDQRAMKIVIFGIYFHCIHFNIKKSQITKSLFGSRRSNCNKTLNHFLTLVCHNIGINVINNGVGFFNVQLGCSEIRMHDIGKICVCEQENCNQPTQESDQQNCCNEFIKIGNSDNNEKRMFTDFYLTGNLFSETKSEEVNHVENDINRLNSITSQECYMTMYPREKCLETFNALWFDYAYFMQIVNTNLHESQIDLLNLCNTDGIRESSKCNLYIGPSILEINSYFVHNMREIIKSLDTSRYVSFFRSSNNDETNNIFYPLEEQVARIHEFVPVREHLVCIVNVSIKIHSFTESHKIPDEFPILQLNINCLSLSKLAPMYPKALIDCVSMLNTNFLKESIDLINKCYMLKSFEMKGISISFLLPVMSYLQESTKHYVKTDILTPCDIILNEKILLYPDNWKTTTLLLKERKMNVSKIKLTLIPSILKACILIIGSNYPWVILLRTSRSNNSSYASMYNRLDEYTIEILGAHSFLIESCHQCFYQNQTYELHLCLPNFELQSRETSNSSFIDARMSHETLLMFLQEPETSFIIPVLDNKDDDESIRGDEPQYLFILSCRIPKQTKPVHCPFNLKCQMGSINFMFSQPFISWFIYPLLDLNFEKYLKSDIFPTFSTGPKTSSTNRSNPTIPDIRSMADGSSRPQSPIIFYNKQPVPGHPKSFSNNTEKPDNKDQNKLKFLSTNTGWWNVVKESCSKYFFLLQSLDVCIKMFKSKFYIISNTDLSHFKSKSTSCNEWVSEFFQNKQEDGSIFIIRMTRIALINSHRREYLHEKFQTSHFDSLNFQKKPTKIIDSLPWELMFHDIRIDCVYSSIHKSTETPKLLYDSILKPVSINCTLSATPKCLSPDKLDSLYSVSWGVHIDVTEVQPTIKQIYLSKLLNLFGNVILGLPWIDLMKNLQCIMTGHYLIVKENLVNKYILEENSICRSKHSVSTKSTKRSKSSIKTNEEQFIATPKSQIVNSKLETQSINEFKSDFKMSFWIQCTLSQFQLIIMNEKIDKDEDIPYVYLMLQVDDTTSCIDIQEKFVEIKGKLSSVLCQIGLMKHGKIISEIPILKTGSKFIKSTKMPFSYKSLDESIHITDELSSENVIRHCFSIAIIRTTVNNLSKRPISSYHQFSDTESFKSYPTEFTGNFSTAIDLNNKYQTYVTQISCIIDPFDLYLPPFFLNQCIELSNTFVLLCNQVLQTSNQKWSLPKKDVSPLNAGTIRNEPYFITEDMPQFYLLVKSSRIILPRYKSEKASIYDQQIAENGCIIMLWDKISLQPFSNNAISRPQIFEKEKEENFSFSDSESKCILCLEDNRQFQLDIFHYGIYLNHSTNLITSSIQNQLNLDGIQLHSNQSSDVFITSSIHGQNPAFEWNNVSKLSSFVQTNSELDLISIMKPIDIQIIFAGAIHESPSTILKRQLAGGYGFEINVLTNLEFLLDNYALDIIQSVIANVNEIFNYHSEQATNEVSPNDKVPNVYSLEDFCQMRNIDNFIPCVPINILMTTRKIQIFLLLQNNSENCSLSSVHGASISIFQPHAMLSFKDRQNHKFEIAIFDVSLSVTPFQWSEKINFSDQNQPNFWFNRDLFLLAEMKTIMKTKPGRPDIKTGVPASLLSVIFTNFYKSSKSKCSVSITRQVLLNIDIEDMTQLSGLARLLTNRFTSTNKSESSISCTRFSFPWFILVPNNIYVCIELFSVVLLDHKNNESQYEIKIGPLNISSNLIRNYQWNTLYLKVLFRCDNVVIIQTSSSGQLSPNFILNPVKISGEAILSCYRFNSLEDHWRSYERILQIDFGVLNLELEEVQIIRIHRLFKTICEILSCQTDMFPLSTKMNINKTADNRVEIFYDELRTNKFQLITTSSYKENDYVAISGPNTIAEDGTISFSDDNDDIASMMWTYPEPRCIISLEVKPVPFVFIECNFVKDSYEQLQIPCKLEYWNIFTNKYEICQTFNLSENRTEKMENLPTLEQLSQPNSKVVVAKSWRVVFDCYARYVCEDKKINANVEKAMLVYLSPLVLAASMMVDSCYCPFLVTGSLMKISVPQIEFTFHEKEWDGEKMDISKPYKLVTKIYEDYSISDHNILFKCVFEDILYKHSINEIQEIEILKIEIFISDPFLALQLPIAMLEHLKGRCCVSEINEEQISIEIDACQFGFDTISLKQICVTFDKIKRMINEMNDVSLKTNTLTYNKSQFIFCNNLNRRIRIKQKDDDFIKISNTPKCAGIGFGEAVLMKFIPIKQNLIKCKDEDINISNDKIELVLGLCSELKGTTKWTDPVDLSVPNFNDISMPRTYLGIWKLDKIIKSEVSILTNSSSLSNSFNSRNLFFIHNYDSGGLNKIIIFGNTVIKNITSHNIHINFSLPTEISSGVSFSVPPQMNSLLTSQYINWKFIATSNFKNIFELSFRITNSGPENVEYRSLSYQMEVPKCNEYYKTNHYQKQIIIKLKLYKTDGQIISSRNLHFQFLCTLEWFSFSDSDEMFLLITTSPLIIFQNQMLRDVQLEIYNTSTNDQSNPLIKEERLIVQGKGGNLKLMNLFPIDNVNLNASFINDTVKLFEKPLSVSEEGVLESLSTKLNSIYQNKFNKIEESKKLEYIADIILQVFDNNEHQNDNHYLHNPYSVMVTITPWILISNRTQLNLVLNFDNCIYYLESNSDFVPPQSKKPIKLGMTFRNDIYWSSQFLVGREALNQNEIASAEILWNFGKEDGNEGILQLNIKVGRNKYLVPLTLKHVFIDNGSNTENQINKFCHLIIESTVFITNQSDTKLAIEALSLKQSSDPIEENQEEKIFLFPMSDYIAISQFQLNNSFEENDILENLILKIHHVNTNDLKSFFNYLKLVNFNLFSYKSDNEMETETNFLYIENNNEETNSNDFEAFMINTTVNLKIQKLFLEIFPCTFVPIIIHNWFSKIMLINELVNEIKSEKSSVIQIKPGQSVPYWPIDYQISMNKEDCGDYSKLNNMFRFGVETEKGIDWTEYFTFGLDSLPSTIEIVTLGNGDKFKLVLNSDTCAMMRLDILTQDQVTMDTVSKPSHISMKNSKKLSISRMSLSLLERQTDLETLIESVRVSIENLLWNFSSDFTNEKSIHEICFSHIQIDNKLFSSGFYDFPVVLNSQKINSNDIFLSAHIESANSSNYVLNVTFHDELELFLENEFLFDMLRIFSQLVNCLVPKYKGAASPSLVMNMPVLHIDSINLSHINLSMTAHAFLKIYVSCEATNLRLPPFVISNSSLKFSTLQKLLWQHYVTAVLLRFGYVLGSIELFGNPSGIFRHFATGFTNLLSSRNIDHGLLVDFLLRLLSFCRHTSGGFISSFTGIASSLSRNFDYCSLDDTHIVRQDLLRRKNQSNGVMHGFMRGLSGLALSLLGAVAGLADQPIQASQEALNSNSSVSIAVIKGLGKGLIGAVTKPLSGTAELFAQTGRGLLNTTGIAINRTHSNLLPFTLISKSNILINSIHFLHISLDISFTNEDGIPMIFWSSFAENDENIPVYLFLTKYYLIEWLIGNPLKNRKNLYCLSNFNLSVSSPSKSRHCLQLQYSNKQNDFAGNAFLHSSNVDNRISAFISDLQQVKQPESAHDASRTSSIDSTDYVKLSYSLNSLGASSGPSSLIDKGDRSVFAEQFNFHSTRPLDGVLDALTFLNYQRDQRL